MGNQSEFSLGYTNSEHAVVELSDNQKINNIIISSADQRKIKK